MGERREDGRPRTIHEKGNRTPLKRRETQSVGRGSRACLVIFTPRVVLVRGHPRTQSKILSHSLDSDWSKRQNPRKKKNFLVSLSLKLTHTCSFTVWSKNSTRPNVKSLGFRVGRPPFKKAVRPSATKKKKKSLARGRLACVACVRPRRGRSRSFFQQVHPEPLPQREGPVLLFLRPRAVV